MESHEKTRMTLQVNQREARTGPHPGARVQAASAKGAGTLITLRAHLDEADSNAIVAVPAPRRSTRPRLVPRRRRRLTVPERPAICFWPESDRPREKLLERGPQALSEAELIALLLGSGTKGRSAVDVARSLIEEFGSLREMLNADKQRWEGRLGIGPARYAALMASIEIARRYLMEPLRETSSLSTPEATRRFLLAQLRDRHYEVFCCVFLDNRHRMLAFEEVFRGTIDGASVYPREIVRQTLIYNAASVIVAHNHPSGVAEPSLADEGVTCRLRQALSLIDVRLLDHFIVGDGKCYSFSEHGLL
jgi:DNA repair protein RadC